MFKFGKQKKIEEYKNQITELERKMNRSRSGFVQAMLAGREPEPEDVKYHQMYMDQIEELRKKIRELEG